MPTHLRGHFCLLDPGGYLLSRRLRNGRGASGLKPTPFAPLLAVPPPRFIPRSGRSAPSCFKSSALRMIQNNKLGFRATLRQVRESRVTQETQTNKRPCNAWSFVLLDPGGYLLSRTVSSQVPSAYEGLTTVFGMGTGGSLQLNHRKGVVFVVNTLKTA